MGLAVKFDRVIAIACRAAAPDNLKVPAPHRLGRVQTTLRSIDSANDVVGHYLDPAGRAVLLCLDEQSQTEALHRSQPGLPITDSYAATMTHDDKLHATSSQFTALAVKSRRAIGDYMSRRRARELLKFLRRIGAVQGNPAVHLILDS